MPFSFRSAGVLVALAALAVASWATGTVPPPRFIGTGAAALAAGSSRPNPARSGVAAQVTATSGPISTVGALFAGDRSSSCTASVVASATGDVILTAAHCVSGDGAGLVFAPAWQHQTAPFGTWVTVHAYAAPEWITGAVPSFDYVFLTVKPAATNPSQAPVQDVVGGNLLWTGVSTTPVVTVSAYNRSDTDTPVTCTTPTYPTSGYPSFDCDGFADGTSGAPWLADYDPSTGTGLVAAVIGGLYQGGCTPATSYSPPFTDEVARVLERASSGGRPDVLPSPPASGC